MKNEFPTLKSGLVFLAGEARALSATSTLTDPVQSRRPWDHSAWSHGCTAGVTLS